MAQDDFSVKLLVYNAGSSEHGQEEVQILFLSYFLEKLQIFVRFRKS